MDEELRRIAAQIRTWRDQAGLTLQDLAHQSGVSASTVHKIENLQTVPTIGVLLKVVAGLRRRPAELFGGNGGSGDVALTRFAERDARRTRPGTLLNRIVAVIPGASLDVWRVTHDPGYGSRPPGETGRLSYNGELIILVESGALYVEVDDAGHTLGLGDSLHFKTSKEHFWRNDGDAPMTALFFGTLPRGLQEPPTD